MPNLLLTILIACATILMPISSAFSGEITVSAAASLTNAFTELRKAAKQKFPDMEISLNFAASTLLLQQIRAGAPVDVFATADQATMDHAIKESLIVPESRINFAANSLVAIVPVQSTLQSIADIHKAKQVAIGNTDSVPAGRYARASLISMGIWDSLKDRFILGNNVRQVLDYISRGEADVGFVYATDALVASDAVKVIGVMDGHASVLYPVAVVSFSRNKEQAQIFLAFIQSNEGMAILQKYGFAKP